MFIILVKRLFAYFKNVLAGKFALYSGEAISDSLSKEIFLFLQNNETSFIHSFVPSVESGKAERSGAENEPRDIHPNQAFPYIGRM